MLNRVMKVLAGVLSLTVVIINIYFVIDWVRETLPAVWWVDLLLAMYGISYIGFIGYLTTLLYGAMGGPGFDRIRARVMYNDSWKTHDWDDPEVNEPEPVAGGSASCSASGSGL